jgi:hypothetical protein
MAKYQTSCGDGACHCSFAFFDLELAKVWLNTANEYLGLARKPHKDLPLRQLPMPCRLNTLEEHDMCLQQWTVLNLWIGIISLVVYFIIEIIFMLDTKLIGFGTILANAVFRLVCTLFLTHLVWFGVVKKHGCCCAIACCCEGKPNLLATSIVVAISGLAGAIQSLQLLTSGYAILVVPAIFVFVQATALLYLAFEAWMIWRHAASTPTPSVEVGTPVGVVAKKEAEECQSQTLSTAKPCAGEASVHVEDAVTTNV